MVRKGLVVPIHAPDGPPARGGQVGKGEGAAEHRLRLPNLLMGPGALGALHLLEKLLHGTTSFGRQAAPYAQGAVRPPVEAFYEIFEKKVKRIFTFAL